MRLLARMLCIFVLLLPALALGQGYPNPVLSNDIRAWGCSTSLSDNGPCINKAIANNQNGTVNIPGVGIFLVSTPIVSSGNVNILGQGGNTGIYTQTCTVGLRQNAANIDLLKLQAGGSVRNLCIDQASGIANTSGHAIYSKNPSAFTGSVQFTGNTVYGACFGIGLTADAITTPSAQNLEGVISNNIVVPAANNACAAYVIGDASKGGQTGDVKMEGNSVYCGNNFATGLLIKDSGGTYLSNNVFGYQCHYGTALLPGAGQFVTHTQAVGSVLGDTSQSHDLYIDTLDSTAVVFNNHFVGTWGASATAGTSVYVRNAAAAPSISGLYFRNFITYMYNNTNGYDIGDDWRTVFIQDSTICTAQTTNTAAGIAIGGSVSDVNIQGNKIGACGSFNPGTLAVGVSIATSNPDIGIITGNTLGSAVNPITTPISWTPGASVNNLLAIVTNNTGIDDIPANVASASSITLPLNPNVIVSGTTQVNNIVGSYWQNRKVQFTTSTGTVTFAQGGSGAGAICNSVTATQFTSVLATYNSGFGCWFLK